MVLDAEQKWNTVSHHNQFDSNIRAVTSDTLFVDHILSVSNANDKPNGFIMFFPLSCHKTVSEQV